MKNYCCTLCGYRFVSAFRRDERDDPRSRMPYPAAVRFADPSSESPDFNLLPEAWRCPHCGALKRFFRPEPDRPARGS